jgi:hypothetical protein
MVLQGVIKPHKPLDAGERIHMRGYAVQRVSVAHENESTACTKAYRVTSPIKKRPPPWDPPRALGIGLR